MILITSDLNHEFNSSARCYRFVILKDLKPVLMNLKFGWGTKKTLLN